MALENLSEIEVPKKATATRSRPPVVPERAPDLVKKVTALMIEGKGDLLPVSAFPVDGTWPTGTSQWEKRNIAREIPVWDATICSQCNKCAFVCPHAAIRTKIYPVDDLAGAPSEFLAVDFQSKELTDMKYTVQVAPEDCTGCRLCVEVCPAKDKMVPRHKAIDMHPQPPVLERERANYDLFLGLAEAPRDKLRIDVKSSQFLEPLFEYSGACAGCGETPYVKLLTQLFGDRALIANATGCSSIYGGNLPTTPYRTNTDGRGLVEFALRGQRGGWGSASVCLSTCRTTSRGRWCGSSQGSWGTTSLGNSSTPSRLRSRASRPSAFASRR